MPLLFNWKPKRLVGVTIKRQKALDQKKPDTADEPVDSKPNRLSSDLPYIDRSSSPSTVNFPLKKEGSNPSPTKSVEEEMRRHSPQRHGSPQKLQNGNDYFPRRQNQHPPTLRQVEADYGLARVQRNVHFDDEPEADGEQEEEETVESGRG